MALFFKRLATLILGLALTTQLAVAWTFSDLLNIFSSRKQTSNQQVLAQAPLASKSPSQSHNDIPTISSTSAVVATDASSITINIKEASKEAKDAKPIEKQASANLSQSPLVVIINGTSSAGKSSIAKQMSAMLGKNWEVISVDDCILNEFFRQYPQTLLNNALIEDICLKRFQSFGVGEFFTKGNFLAVLAERVHHCCAEGKSVIVDTVLYPSPKNFDYFISALKDCNVCHCLVYCPLPELIRRVLIRNERASRKGATIAERLERRDFARAVRRFGTLYTYGSTHTIDRLAETDREAVLSLVREDYVNSCLTTDGKQTFEQFYAEFEKNMGSDRMVDTIQPVLPYDIIVNSSMHNPYQCACRIIDYISSQRDDVNGVVSVG